MPTLGGILYSALNFSITSLESTRRFELTHFLRSFEEKLTVRNENYEGLRKLTGLKKRSSDKFLVFVDAHGDERGLCEL